MIIYASDLQCPIKQQYFTDANLAPQSYDVKTCIVVVIEKGSKRKIQNENMCLRGESNLRPLAFQRGSNHSAIGTVDNLLLKLLVYFFKRLYQSTRVTMHV